MVCPFYRDGYCISPMLPQPDNTVTSPNRCYNTFKTCRYFDKEKAEKHEKEGLDIFTKINPQLYFSPIYVIDDNVESQCEFFIKSKTDDGQVAYCRLLDRVLVESHAKLCADYEHCPFRTLLSIQPRYG